MNNLELWNKVKAPPKEALKTIKGGRLSGMTDISPQWRYQAMTEQFGVCGIGWKYTVENKWIEKGYGEDVFAFADISLFIKIDGEWSEAIPGHGGNKLVVAESKGVHNNDEAYKMAITDALSTAMKMLGFGADIYMGKFDGSKYAQEQKPVAVTKISEAQVAEIVALAEEVGVDVKGKAFLDYLKVKSVKDILATQFKGVIAILEKKR